MKKIFLVLAAVVALTACQKSAPTPTGDAEKDAKACAEYIIEKAKSCNSKEELFKMANDFEQLDKAFEDYGAKNPEYKAAYDKACEQLEDQTEKEMNEIVEKLAK